MQLGMSALCQKRTFERAFAVQKGMSALARTPVKYCGSVAGYSRVYFRLGTDLPKTRPLQFAFLVAACTIAAASLVIIGKTMGAASPDDGRRGRSSALSSNFVTSALPVAAWAIALTQRGNQLRHL